MCARLRSAIGAAGADGQIADATVLARVKELVDAAVLLDGAYLGVRK